jgi:putative transposase
MGRAPRNSQGGYVYHVIGRGLKPKPMFRSLEDYQDFDSILARAVDRFEPRLLSYCVLPKHWHLVLTPRKDGDLSKFMAWLTTTHSARWHTKPKRSDSGGLYERRFRSFPVQDNAQLLDVLRFVESHPLRSGLVETLGAWPWLSSTRRVQESVETWPLLSSPPVPFPADWNKQLTQEIPAETIERVCHCIQRGCPYGSADWVQKTAVRLGIESTIRTRGRPRKVATP